MTKSEMFVAMLWIVDLMQWLVIAALSAGIDKLTDRVERLERECDGET